jgi:uncharacterized protein (TIGR02611 family)
VLTWRHARQLVILVVGGTLLLFGIALVVLPGPATVVIPLALAILGTEFLWARRLLKRVRDGVTHSMSAVRRTSIRANDAAPATAESTRESASK